MTFDILPILLYLATRHLRALATFIARECTLYTLYTLRTLYIYCTLYAVCPACSASYSACPARPGGGGCGVGCGRDLVGRLGLRGGGGGSSLLLVRSQVKHARTRLTCGQSLRDPGVDPERGVLYHGFAAAASTAHVAASRAKYLQFLPRSCHAVSTSLAHQVTEFYAMPFHPSSSLSWVKSSWAETLKPCDNSRKVCVSNSA